MKAKQLLSRVVTVALVVCLAATLLAMVGCGGDKVTVEISQTTATVQEGSSITLTATASDGSNVTWKSDKEDVATVSAGRVTAKKAGTVTITAESGKASASCVVTVTAREKVTLNKTSVSLAPGGSETLTATASDNSEITWSSNNESVVTVNNGVLTAIGEGSATISAKSETAMTATCQVTVTDPDATDAINDGETVAYANAGKWYYWYSAEYGWAQATVTVDKARVGGDGSATFTYSGNTGAFYGMQIFYESAATQNGTTYKMTCKIHSDAAGSVTVSGAVVDLVAGDNNVEVYFTESASAASFKLIMGVEGAANISAATVRISDLQFEQATLTKLATPTAIAFDSDKKVTITDENEGVEKYSVEFHKNGALAYSVVLPKTGGTLNDAYFFGGAYDVKVKALGAGNTADSDLSDVLTQYVCANESVTYDLVSGGADDATANPGIVYCWNDQNWCGSNVTVAEKTYADGTITVAYSGATTACWFGLQLFYKNTANIAGENYSLTCKINSTTAGKITVNGKVIELVEGDNNVTVESYREGLDEGKNLSLSIQMGVNGGNDGETTVVSEATIIISDLVFTKL